MNLASASTTRVLLFGVLGIAVTAYFFSSTHAPVDDSKRSTGASVAERQHTAAKHLSSSPASAAVNSNPVVSPATMPHITQQTSQQQAVVAAWTTKTKPWLYDMNTTLPAFDEAEYWADPAAYVAVAAPGRVFQTLPVTSVDTPHTYVSNGYHQALIHGEQATISVQVPPNAPVNFLAASGGIFAESSLGYVSVQANANGHAHATFVPDKGTVNVVPILVSSPLAADVQTIAIEVRPPVAHLPL